MIRWQDIAMLLPVKVERRPFSVREREDKKRMVHRFESEKNSSSWKESTNPSEITCHTAGRGKGRGPRDLSPLPRVSLGLLMLAARAAGSSQREATLALINSCTQPHSAQKEFLWSRSAENLRENMIRFSRETRSKGSVRVHKTRTMTKRSK